jgi:hypothetical protein
MTMSNENITDLLRKQKIKQAYLDPSRKLTLPAIGELKTSQ